MRDVALGPAGTPGRPSRLLGWGPTALALALLVVLVLPRLAQGLSEAEAVRGVLAERPLSALWAAGPQAAPSLYDPVLWLWARALGSSETALRLPSLLWTIVTLVAVGGVARGLGHSLPATVGPPLLVPLSPLVVACATEVGPYAQAMALGALATWRYATLLGADRGREARGPWLVYAGLLAAGLLTHPFVAATLLAHGAHALARLRSNRPWFRAWGLVCLAALVAWAGWAVAGFAQGGQGPLPGGPISVPLAPAWGGPVWAVGALALLGVVEAASHRTALLTAALAAMPVLMLGVLGPALIASEGKALVLTVPGVALVLGAGLGWLGRRAAALPVRPGLRAAMGASTPLLAALALAIAGWGALQALGFARPDYRGLIARVLTEGREGDVVVLADTGLLEAVQYYNRRRAPVVHLEASGSAEEVGRLLGPLAQASPRLWVLTPLGGRSESAANLDRWLAEHLYPVARYGSGGVGLDLYLGEPEMRSGQGRTTFGGIVELPEVALPAGTVGRDLGVPVRLHWRAREPLASRLVVFAHLVTDGGSVLAAREGEPVGGLRPTTTWEVGEVVVDRLALSISEEVAVGSYRVRVGLQELGTGARLRLADGRDALEIGTVRIGPASRQPLMTL